MAAKSVEITNWELMEKQVWYYRTHLDVFIQHIFAPVRLTPTQRVIARSIGNCSDVKVICSRGYGKTFLIALCAAALCCLYPQTTVGVCSMTAAQATLIVGKLKDLCNTNSNLMNEVYIAPGSRSPIKVSREKSQVHFKNGSRITSFSLESMRGSRFKIVIIDEALEMKQDDLDAIVSPTTNFRRNISFENKFPDFKSKRIAISSACEKSNDMYQDFTRLVREMAKGNKDAFCCALNYQAALQDGITDEDFFEKERRRMPTEIFNIEYGSIFAGASSNSAFPHQLMDRCRVLQSVELEQPKNSKSRYIMSVDIATSQAKGADNTIISVIKFNELMDGTFVKKLVYMRSFHGLKLDKLMRQMRILAHTKFPNIEKILYDARGVGDSLSRFFKDAWVDVLNGKEYPPLSDDDQPYVSGALQLLHPVRAVQTLNQRIYTNMRVAMQQRTLQIPISSRQLLLSLNEEVIDDDDETGTKKKKREMSMQERAIFLQSDALIIEMGNIVGKVGASGNVLYDVPSITMHKDRYSSLAYGVDYISQLQKDSVRRRRRGAPCVGVVSSLPETRGGLRRELY